VLAAVPGSKEYIKATTVDLPYCSAQMRESSPHAGPRRRMITDSASGIGRALAVQLAAHGVPLTLADIEADPLAAIATALGAHHRWQQRPADWQWILQVNLIGMANILHSFGPASSNAAPVTSSTSPRSPA
jgi:hypothetical protein